MASMSGVRDGGSGAETSQELLARATGGDPEAVETLVGRYLPRMRRWAAGRLPAWARERLDTDDLVQESTLRAVERLAVFRPRHGGGFHAYLRQAILNRIRDEVRRSQRRPQQSEVDSGLPDQRPSPLEQAIGREDAERYEAALARLDLSDREAIVARIEMGCSYDELAVALNRPSPDAARMAVARALVRLAREIAR
jgi:RNA polymerase sigma factor (sigma-70 family)